MTKIDNTIDKITSAVSRVSIDVEPKSVVHTSDEILVLLENKFIVMYPNASEDTEIMARVESFDFLLLSSIIAAMIVINRVSHILFVNFNANDTAIAPNAT